jgi:hypothetical protein
MPPCLQRFERARSKRNLEIPVLPMLWMPGKNGIGDANTIEAVAG